MEKYSTQKILRVRLKFLGYGLILGMLFHAGWAVDQSNQSKNKYYRYKNLNQPVQFDKKFQDSLLSKKNKKPKSNEKSKKNQESSKQTPLKSFIKKTKSNTKTSISTTDTPTTPKSSNFTGVGKKKKIPSSIIPLKTPKSATKSLKKTKQGLFNPFYYVNHDNQVFWNNTSPNLHGLFGSIIGIPLRNDNRILDVTLGMESNWVTPTHQFLQKVRVQQIYYSLAVKDMYLFKNWAITPYMKALYIDSFFPSNLQASFLPGLSYWYKIWNINGMASFPLHASGNLQKRYYVSTGLSVNNWEVNALVIFQHQIGYGFYAILRPWPFKYVSFPIKIFWLHQHIQNIIGMGIGFKFQDFKGPKPNSLEQHIWNRPLLFSIENIISMKN